MNPLQQMELHKNNFTPNDQLIYETIIANPSSIVHMTTSTLAETCGVSQPALSRFVKSLGYSRYQDFRAELISWLAQQTEQDAQDSGHLRYFNTIYQLLAEAEKKLTAEYMQELAHYISGFDRIFASGISKSAHPAQLFEILMRKTKRYIHAISRDSLLEIGDYMDENDLLIIFSVSAQDAIMRDASRTNGKIMLVTTNPNYNYGEKVDREVLLPYIPPNPEESSISPVLFDMFVELLVSFIAQELSSEKENL